MIKRTIAALFIVLAGFFVFVGVQHVHARPYSYHSGISSLTWSYNVRAGTTNMQARVMTLSGTGAYWQSEIEMGSDVSKYVEVGLEDDVTGTSHQCTAGNWFFIAWEDNSGAHNICYPMNGITNYCDFAVGERNGDNSDMYLDIDCGNGTGPCPAWSCNIAWSGSFPTFTYIVLRETVDDNWAGTFVKNTWGYNKYINTNDWNWRYRTTPSNCNQPGDGCPVFASAPPPQMYWLTFPSNSSTGGTLQTCERSDGNQTC